MKRLKTQLVLLMCLAPMGCMTPRALSPDEMHALLLSQEIEAFAYSTLDDGSTQLLLSSGSVTNLDCLKGVQIDHLIMHDTFVTDLNPLRRMDLKSLRFTPSRQDTGINVLRNCQSLTNINDMLPTDFWAKYDAGEFVDPPETDPLQQFMKAFYQQHGKRLKREHDDFITFDTLKTLMELRNSESNKSIQATP